MASRTCRSCSFLFPLTLLFLGCWTLDVRGVCLTAVYYKVRTFLKGVFYKRFVCLQMRHNELKRDEHRSNTKNEVERDIPFKTRNNH